MPRLEVPVASINDARFQLLFYGLLEAIDPSFLSDFDEWQQLESQEVQIEGFEYAYRKRRGTRKRGLETTSRHSVESRASATVFEDFVTIAYGMEGGSFCHTRIGGVQIRAEEYFDLEANADALQRARFLHARFIENPNTIGPPELDLAVRFMKRDQARGYSGAAKPYADLVLALDPNHAEAVRIAESIPHSGSIELQRRSANPATTEQDQSAESQWTPAVGSIPELRIEIRKTGESTGTLDLESLGLPVSAGVLNRALRAFATVPHSEDYEWLLIEWICDACEIDSSVFLKYVTTGSPPDQALRAWVEVRELEQALELLLRRCAEQPEALAGLQLDQIGFATIDLITAYECLLKCCRQASKQQADELRILYSSH